MKEYFKNFMLFFVGFLNLSFIILWLYYFITVQYRLNKNWVNKYSMKLCRRQILRPVNDYETDLMIYLENKQINKKIEKHLEVLEK